MPVTEQKVGSNSVRLAKPEPGKVAFCFKHRLPGNLKDPKPKEFAGGALERQGTQVSAMSTVVF